MKEQYLKWLTAASAALLLTGCPAEQEQVGSASVKAAPVAGAFPDYSTEDVGAHFDPAKIAALEARMAKFVTDGDAKGIATLLVKDGKVISHMQSGQRRVSDGAPISEDTIYRIYSMTKPVTGVALMMLHEEGKFSLDDPVSKFVPEFEKLQVVKSFDNKKGVVLEPLNRQPTMRELMSHTAGFAYGLYGDDPSNLAFKDQKILESPDMLTFIDKVSKVPLMFQPGERWFYSAAVDIQGAVVERLSGQTLGAFFKQRIFDPLGMDDTGFYVPEEDYDRFSDVFGFNPMNGKMMRVPFPAVMYRQSTIGMESGGGGLVSTLDDYARFAQMLANDGELDGNRILQPETLKLMRTNVLKPGQTVNIAGTLTQATTDYLGFGLDFGIIKNDGSGATPYGNGTYFWGGAAGTWFWVDPVNDLFFIGMIQRFSRGGPPVDFRGISGKMVYEAMKSE